MVVQSGSRKMDSAHIGLIGREVANGQAANGRGSGLTCKLSLSREARENQRPRWGSISASEAPESSAPRFARSSIAGAAANNS